MLTKSDRAKRHAGVARWMETHIDDRPPIDRIAHHYATAARLAAEIGADRRPPGGLGRKPAGAGPDLAREGARPGPGGRARAGRPAGGHQGPRAGRRRRARTAAAVPAGPGPGVVQPPPARAGQRRHQPTPSSWPSGSGDEHALARALVGRGDVEQKASRDGGLGGVADRRHRGVPPARRPPVDGRGPADPRDDPDVRRRRRRRGRRVPGGARDLRRARRPAGRGVGPSEPRLARLHQRPGRPGRVVADRLDRHVPPDRRHRRARVGARAAGLGAVLAGPVRRGRGARRADPARRPAAGRQVGRGHDAGGGGPGPSLDGPDLERPRAGRGRGDHLPGAARLVRRASGARAPWAAARSPSGRSTPASAR